MRRRREAGTPTGEIEIYSNGRGLVVAGSTTDVTAFIDSMMATTREAGGRARHMVVDSLQIAANLVAYQQTHREYIEFSARALKLLKEHGAIANGDGSFRSFVRKAGQFAGNLDWKRVDLGPERALSMQAAAGQMALKAAIREITDAVKRVEGKVDQLVRLVQAERLGAVLGDRATLKPLVERYRRSGEFSATDWSTVDHLGPLIARDIETLRAYLMQRLASVDESPRVASRASEADDLADELLQQFVALLVVAEQNYALWQELRLGHAIIHEPGAVASLAADINSQLAELERVDQELADCLDEVVDRLARPTGYEGFAPLNKRKLSEHTARLEHITAWFADQRHLDHEPRESVGYPTLVESATKAAGVLTAAVRRVNRPATAAAQSELGTPPLETQTPPELKS